MDRHVCVNCGKKMYSGSWTVKAMPGLVMRFGEFILNESLFFNEEKTLFLCGGCRRESIKNLNKKPDKILQMNPREITCAICEKKYKTVNYSNETTMRIVSVGEFYVCEECLCGKQKEFFDNNAGKKETAS